jgi:AcrR family transcriptional regulator
VGTDERVRGRPSPRRAPRDDERGKTANRTRAKILDAAVAEFGAKGYSGARTAGIAERAGVNQQLIAYYFGGKQGLLEELRRRWSTAQDELTPPPDASFADSLRAWLDSTLDNPDWARLVVWRALGDAPNRGDNADEEQRRRVQQGVERIRTRQDDGEITNTVSAEFVTLLAHMVAFAPIAMPHIVHDMLGVDPGSPAYREWCGQQLVALLMRA